MSGLEKADPNLTLASGSVVHDVTVWNWNTQTKLEALGARQPQRLAGSEGI
jgi:hypothetical protein